MKRATDQTAEAEALSQRQKADMVAFEAERQAAATAAAKQLQEAA